MALPILKVLVLSAMLASGCATSSQAGRGSAIEPGAAQASSMERMRKELKREQQDAADHRRRDQFIGASAGGDEFGPGGR